MWESRSKTKNAGGHERLLASESFAHDGGRNGLDGDKHLDERRHRTRAFHTIQLVKTRRFVDTNGFHHDFEKTGNETCAGSGLRLVQDGSQSGACCSFAKTENEIHDEEWREPAWLGARRLDRMAAEMLTEWENWNAMVLLLMENGEDTQEIWKPKRRL